MGALVLQEGSKDEHIDATNNISDPSVVGHKRGQKARRELECQQGGICGDISPVSDPDYMYLSLS